MLREEVMALRLTFPRTFYCIGAHYRCDCGYHLYWDRYDSRRTQTISNPLYDEWMSYQHEEEEIERRLAIESDRGYNAKLAAEDEINRRSGRASKKVVKVLNDIRKRQHTPKGGVPL